jgi:exosortase
MNVTMRVFFGEKKLPATVAAYCLLLALLFVWLYGHTLHGLFDDWWNDPDYSYGLAVPLVVIYILYRRREKLRRLPRQPARAGAAIYLLLAQMSYLLGYFGAEFFLQRTSIVLLLCGTVLLLFGTQMLRSVAFPLLLLQLCVPLPALIMMRITMPLQLIASAAAEKVLRLCLVPVYRTGNLLQMSQQTLNVGEACSGIRSLISLITLSVILAGFSKLRWPLRMVLVASAAPVAIVTNALRVSGAGLLSYYGSPALTHGLWHLMEGWLVFVAAFLLLSVELRLLSQCLPKEDGQ